MLDSETTVTTDPRNERVSVSMRDRGFEVVMFFEWKPDAHAKAAPPVAIGDGPLLEVRLLPDREPMTSGKLREFMPRADLYVRYARASAKFWNREEAGAMLEALREVAKGRTALDDRFYRTVADVYTALVADGERHPVKAMAAMFDRTSRRHRGGSTRPAASGICRRRTTSVASAWITTRATRDGGKRYRVLYRVGGRESTPRYAGSFPRPGATRSRGKAWVTGVSSAAMRVPDLAKLAEPATALLRSPKRQSGWQASRVDVREEHPGSASHGRWGRCGPLNGPAPSTGLLRLTSPAWSRRSPRTVKARESIRKSVTAVAMVLDFAGSTRTRPATAITVRLPREEREEPQPPDADTVEAVAHRSRSRT